MRFFIGHTVGFAYRIGKFAARKQANQNNAQPHQAAVHRDEIGRTDGMHQSFDRKTADHTAQNTGAQNNADQSFGLPRIQNVIGKCPKLEYEEEVKYFKSHIDHGIHQRPAGIHKNACNPDGQYHTAGNGIDEPVASEAIHYGVKRHAAYAERNGDGKIHVRQLGRIKTAKKKRVRSRSSDDGSRRHKKKICEENPRLKVFFTFYGKNTSNANRRDFRSHTPCLARPDSSK